jgi:Fic family protein
MVSKDHVLKAGISHFWFVTIHPFKDGNGRIARAICDMALGLADETPGRFYRLSSQIESERKDYDIHLERHQRATPDLTEWLNGFLHCLDKLLTFVERFMSKKADIFFLCFEAAWQ